MSRGYLPVAVLAACLSLSACGGGGGSVATIPPPPPPPPQVTYETFPLTKSATFDTISASRADHHESGVTVVDTFGVSPRGSNVSISYDASTNSYTVKNGAVSASFNSSNLSSSSGYIDSYRKISGSGSIEDDLQLYNNVRSGASQASAPVQLSYLSYGVWKHNDFTTVDEYSTTYFLFGYPTDTSDMPKSGSASYTTAVTGDFVGGNAALQRNAVGGSATFDVDFGTGKILTDLTLNLVAGDQTIGLLGVYNGSGMISGDQFSGSFTSSDPNVTGSFDGGFFGPAAKEMGYTFIIDTRAASTDTGTIAGVVVGTKK